MKRISYSNAVATPPITDTEIEIVENKLLDLAIEGDREAAQEYYDLYLCRLDWERTRSAERWQDFVDQAQTAHAWLAINSL